MKGLEFFDANILIYVDDASAKNKRERAISLIVEHRAANYRSIMPRPFASWELRRRLRSEMS
jgi:hypothetical protein